jgi:hypothetical protein
MCLIPANPDISGIGVRVAIYAQNLLSFVPAFYALVDGRVDGKELQTIEAQSTTILVTAFAILISTIVQALSPYGLSDFHTSVILNLSWMNNTNTFIYLILYFHHQTGLTGDSRIPPEWAAWWRHIRQGLFVKRNWLPTVILRACTRHQGFHIHQECLPRRCREAGARRWFQPPSDNAWPCQWYVSTVSQL